MTEFTVHKCNGYACVVWRVEGEGLHDTTLGLVFVHPMANTLELFYRQCVWEGHV